jgi:type I restriction-modification system DNA methylase subunit
MNLTVHGLAGDIRQGVTYYEDIHRSVGKFDFLTANPPFNVDRVDKERLKDDPVIVNLSVETESIERLEQVEYSVNLLHLLWLAFSRDMFIA